MRELADQASLGAVPGSGDSEAISKLEVELKEAKQRANKAQEDADEEMARGQTQRIQLLDEVSTHTGDIFTQVKCGADEQLNSLQAEVGELRKQLRTAKGG